jgi:hypothetical protein
MSATRAQGDTVTVTRAHARPGPPSRITYLWFFDHREGDLEATLRAYLVALENVPGEKELVAVANGVGASARDALLPILRTASFPAALLSLHRGSGEGAALHVGVRHSTGDAVVILPPYRQIDETEFARFTEAIREGKLDYIASWRHPRVGSRTDGALSRLFNSIASDFTSVDLHDVNSSLRAMKRVVLEEVPFHGDLHRFLPMLAVMQGFRVGELPVRHVSERVHKGDYHVGILVRRFLDLLSLFFLVKFTRKPLRFFGLIGTAVFGAGALLLLYLLIERLLGIPLSDRPLLVLGAILFVLGAQLFSIGLLGELIIFTYGRENPEYAVERVYDSTNASD